MDMSPHMPHTANEKPTDPAPFMTPEGEMKIPKPQAYVNVTINL